MKIRRVQRWVALIALIVSGFSSMATAATITQVEQPLNTYPHWWETAAWLGGVLPIDNVDSVVLTCNMGNRNDFILGADQTITQTTTVSTNVGVWYFDTGTFDIFGTVDLERDLQGIGWGSSAKDLILEVGSAFSLGTNLFNVAHPNWTTTWIADSAGVTVLQAGTAALTGSKAVVDLTNYDLEESGTTVVLMTTDEGATTFGSLTVLGPDTNKTYAADVVYAYNGNTQIAITNIHMVVVGMTEFSDPDPSEIEMGFYTSSSLVTGSLDVGYKSPTHVNLTVTISEETNPGSFSVLSATPQVLDPEDLETTLSFEFQFDNGVAALVGGQTATGLVTFAWSDVGGPDSGSFSVPISVVASEPIAFVDVDFGDLLDGTEVVNVDGEVVTLTMVYSGDAPALETSQGAGFYKPSAPKQTFTFTSDKYIHLRIGFAEMNSPANEYFEFYDDALETPFTGTIDTHEVDPLAHTWNPEINRIAGVSGHREPVYLTVLSTTGFTVQGYNSAWGAFLGGPGMGIALAPEPPSTTNGTPYPWLDQYDLVDGEDYEAADQEDSDLDGLLNWEEYRCGTVPTNATSVLELNSISEGVAGEYAVAWQGVDGKTYNVLSTDNLVSPTWTTNEAGVAGVEPETVTTQTVSSAAAFFVIELAE